MKNWEMPVMEELMIEETACTECAEGNKCDNCYYDSAAFFESEEYKNKQIPTGGTDFTS